MADSLNKRDENFEIKYLRKALGQVDNRIRIPESVDAASLRPLLDAIEPPSLRESARRSKTRWLSLQSGVAYAAAFVLIVALFYSMELYKPEMIDGGMRITDQGQSPPVIMPTNLPDEAAPAPQADADTVRLEEPDAAAAQQAEAGMQIKLAGPEDAEPSAFAAGGLGVGGSGESILLLEQDGYEYRWRVNDASDPDRTAPVTLEVIRKDSQEFASQIDVAGMTDIRRCFVYDDMLMIVGTSGSEVKVQVYYDLENPAEQLSLSQPGSLVDVRIYKDTVHIVSLADNITNGGEIVALPHTEATDACIITAVNLSTLETSSKTFAGADGTVQLHNLNAYIHYAGTDDDGSPKDYIGQILLEGMDIELGTVS